MSRKKRQRDLAELGWEDGDVLTPRATLFTVPRGQQVMTPKRRQEQRAEFNLDKNRLSIDIPNPLEIMSSSDMKQLGTSSGIIGSMPMAAVLTPQEQMDAQSYARNPNRFIQERIEQQKDVSWVEQGKGIMSRIFDYEDEQKETAIESVWDNMLGNLFWTYDRIAQSGTYVASKALPNVPNLSFDESADVSFGQLSTTSRAQTAREVFGTNTDNPIANLLGANSLSGQYGFNVQDPEQRRQAFVDDLYGKYSSGITDAVFTVFTDPLIYAGWGLKMARVKYVDRPVVTASQISDLSAQITDDVARIRVGAAPETTQGQFINWLFQADETGKRVRTAMDVYKHPVIRWSSNRDQLTGALIAAENPLDAALVLRSAYGDIAARKELLDAKAELAFVLGNAEKDALATRIAFDPSSLSKQAKKYDRVVQQRRDAYLAAEYEATAGRMTAQQVDDFAREYDRALELRQAIDDIDLRSVQAKPVTKSEVKATKDEFDRLLARDEWLRKAADDAMSDSFRQSYKTFSANNRFGLFVEGAREKRAVTAAQVEANAVAPWSKESFYNVGGILGRTVNVWRWAWSEKPSGYVSVRGAAANEQGREIIAMLNAIPEYKGQGKQVTYKGRVVQVGGVERKQELFEDYVRSVGGSVRDENKMALMLDALEKRIFNDIAKYHGLPRSEARAVLRKSSEERNRVLRDLRDRKFFTEEIPAPGGGIERVTHKVPYLETQLQNGTYMLNFSEFSRLAAIRAKQLERGATPLTDGQFASLGDDPIKSASALGRDAATQAVLNAYRTYNNLWRPATLLRLGYTLRNNAEGQFRAAAFTESLMPLGANGIQISNAIRNLVAKRAFNRDLKKLNAATGATALATPRFKKWRERQEQEIEYKIEESTVETNRIRSRLENDLKGIDDELTQDMRLNLEIREQMLSEAKEFRDMFVSDDVMALAYYRSQGAAKRRMHDGTETIDGIEVRGAFADADYAPIALANLSADPTTKMQLSLRDRDATNFFKAVQKRDYVEVYPDQAEYWDGVATMLRQLRRSEVGSKILRGESPERIANWLMTDEVGKQIAEFVTGNVRAVGVSSGKKVGKGKVREKVISKGGFDTSTRDGALGYVETVMARLDQLAPNPQLKKLLAQTDVTAEDVRRLLDTDQFRAGLKPAIGNISIEAGSKGVRDLYRDTVNKLFNWAGTMPEDTFVRTPFYGARYAATRDEMIQYLRDYYGTAARQQGLKPDSAMIPLSEITRAHRIAHRRALKDTKDWLYTIERRTNLGHYGEYIHPFITSAQNSITAVGRLVWKNPALPEYIRLIWQAPDQMNLTDDKGNIVMTLPLEMVPDGVKDKLALSSALSVKIPKGGLNAVFPETGFGILPRFGPFVGVPTQMLMLNGVFGLAPAGYTPDWLTGLLGKDLASTTWDAWRDFVFGEDRAPSTEPLMWDQLVPPAYQRLISLLPWAQFNSRSYASTYEKIRNSEMIRIMGNEREQPENMAEFAKEIQDKTTWHTVLRFLGNMLAFTPPQYQFIGEPLIETRRMYDRSIPEDADKAFYNNMGAFATLFTLGTLTKNTSGLDPTDEAVRLIANHQDLVKEITSNTNDLSALGAIFNGDPENEYSPGAVSWQTLATIPGTTETYRRRLDPVEAQKQQSIRFGWIKYLQLVEGQDAILQQRGLTSYRQKGAENLLQQRRDFIRAAANNPLYNAWYQEFTERGSSRTDSVVRAMRIALNNESFMNEKKGDSTFEAAYLYLQYRDEIVEAVRQSPFQSLRAKGNKDIADQWDALRSALIRRYPKWGIIQNRYLNGDEDPTDLGYQWWQFAAPPESERIDQEERSTMDPLWDDMGEDEEFFRG